MSVYENAKTMSKEEIMEKIAALGIQEAGLCAGSLADRLAASLEEAKEENKETGIVAALNNADTDYVLLDVLKNDPEKVFQGIAIAAMAIGTENRTLCVPESETKLAEDLAGLASDYQVEVTADLVDLRGNKGKAIIHIVTAADLADAFAGNYVPGVYVSVNGGTVKKVPNGTKVAELLTPEELSGAKGLILGCRMCKPDAAALPVEKAGIVNGVVKVLTGKNCVVDETEKRLMASRKQSCGKCVFCREGLIQLQYMHREITQGRGKGEFVDLTKEIGEAMCFSTSCTLGQNSAKIALTAMESFPAEYEAHIRKKKCPSAVCAKLVNIYIDPRRCSGCGACEQVCPWDCIEGQPGYIHMLDDFDCVRCGKCAEVCETGAIVITTGRVPRVPYRLTKAGRFR